MPRTTLTVTAAALALGLGGALIDCRWTICRECDTEPEGHTYGTFDLAWPAR